MNTNVTGFWCFFFENLCVLVLWTKVVSSALEGLSIYLLWQDYVWPMPWHLLDAHHCHYAEYWPEHSSIIMELSCIIFFTPWVRGCSKEGLRRRVAVKLYYSKLTSSLITLHWEIVRLPDFSDAWGCLSQHKGLPAHSILTHSHSVFPRKVSSATFILLRITLEWSKSSQNIWRKVVI